jgi:hypothetical protein
MDMLLTLEKDCRYHTADRKYFPVDLHLVKYSLYREMFKVKFVAHNDVSVLCKEH